MALIKCKECKTDISDEAETCPNCGVKLNETGCLMEILAILVISLVLCALYILL